MIVSVIGEFNNNYITRSKSICNAIKHFGYDIIEYDYKIALINRYNKIFSELPDLSKKSDILIIDKGYNIPPEVIRKMSNNCCKILWFDDQLYNLFDFKNKILESSKYYNYRISSCDYIAKCWSEKTNLATHTIQGGADTSIYYPTETDKIYDITFIGNKTPETSYIYEYLKLCKFNVKFFGNGFSDIIFPEYFREICSQSIICLDVDAESFDGYISQHTWNLIACKSAIVRKSKYTEDYTDFSVFNNLIGLANISKKIMIKNMVKREYNKLVSKISIRTWVDVIKDILNSAKENTKCLV